MGNTRELRKVFFDEIPVKLPKDVVCYNKLIDDIIKFKSSNVATTDLEKIIDERIFDLYELTDEERQIISSIQD